MRSVRQARLVKEAKRYQTQEDDYDALKYWSERHEKYKGSFHAVSDLGADIDATMMDMGDSAIWLGAILEGLRVDKQARILDCGCGTGLHLQHLSKMGYSKLYGADIVDGVWPDAREAFKFYELDLTEKKLPLKPHTLDVVLALDLTLHIVNDNRMRYYLKENVARLLKPNGLFIVADLGRDQRLSYYERARPFNYYAAQLKAKLLATHPYRNKRLAVFEVGG